MMPVEDVELLQRASTEGAKAKLMAVVESDEIILYEVTRNGLREMHNIHDAWRR